MVSIIYISGTPGTGKTTVTKLLCERFDNITCISVNDFARENKLIIGKDFDKKYDIIDIDKLDYELTEYINNNVVSEFVIVEGHVSHLCRGCDKCIIFRLNPEVLKERLDSRDYSEGKVNENLESEILDVCTVEAYNIHEDKVHEIDTTNKSVEDVLGIVLSIIYDELSFPAGNVSFIDYLLK